MKRCIIALLAVVLFGTATPARASLLADFWAVDTDGGGVTLDVSLFSTPATLWFSTDQHNWIRLFQTEDPFSLLSTSLTLGDTTHLFLKMDQIVPTTKSLFAAPATPTSIYSGADGNGLYNSLAIKWTGTGTPFSLSLFTPAGKDGVGSTSSVPIPNAALLFCSGLLGFFAFKRRKLHMAV